jgi:rod shape-determining protein MreC
VGKIVRVDDNHSICQILLDRNAKVSAKIQRNRELGIVAWDGGNLLNMQYIAKTIVVQRGDVVVTSGYSQIFPENIKIGVISDVSLEVEGLFQNISIQPAVNFTQLEEVFIIKEVVDDVER